LGCANKISGQWSQDEFGEKHFQVSIAPIGFPESTLSVLIFAFPPYF
jgi:hypothetical protein